MSAEDVGERLLREAPGFISELDELDSSKEGAAARDLTMQMVALNMNLSGHVPHANTNGLIKIADRAYRLINGDRWEVTYKTAKEWVAALMARGAKPDDVSDA